MRPRGDRYCIATKLGCIGMNIQPDHNDSVRSDANASALIVVSTGSNTISVNKVPSAVHPDIGHREFWNTGVDRFL
jgi:hypothetical protein